jgi:Family of unknown function (DUF6876)
VATLSCGDGNGKILFTKHIEFTDFPLDEILLFVEEAHLDLASLDQQTDVALRCDSSAGRRGLKRSGNGEGK